MIWGMPQLSFWIKIKSMLYEIKRMMTAILSQASYRANISTINLAASLLSRTLKITGAISAPKVIVEPITTISELNLKKLRM